MRGKRTAIGTAIVLAMTACGQQDATAANNTAVATENALANVVEAAAPDTPAKGRSSIYTPLDDDSCPVIETFEETGDWSASCPGHAGYKVELQSGDLRDDVILIDGAKRTHLKIHVVAGNGAFTSIGKKAEWRGPTGGQPDTLIVRAHVANPEGISDNGRLAIVRLKPTPCVVAIVPPSAGQSDRARAIADGDLPECLAD